jgi:hypothetical protein
MTGQLKVEFTAENIIDALSVKFEYGQWAAM